jgi:WD40 repeat protein
MSSNFPPPIVSFLLMTNRKILLLLFASTQLWAQNKPAVDSDFFNNSHPGAVLDLVRSHDGKSLYTIGLEGQIKKWDDLSGKVINTFTVPNGYNDRIALSRDADVVYAGGSKMIYKMDPRSGNVIHRSDYEYLLNFQFLPSKNIMAVAHGYRLEILDGTTNVSLKKLPNEIVGSSTAIQFSADGKLLAFTQSGFKVVVYNTQTWEQVFETSAHPTVIMAIQFIENDRLLIAPKFEPVEIWSLSQATKQNELVDSKGEWPLVFDPAARKIIGFTPAGELKTWNPDGTLVSAAKSSFKPSRIRLRDRDELYLVDGSALSLINYRTQKIIRVYGEEPADVVLVRNINESYCDLLTGDGKVNRLNLIQKTIEPIDSLPGFPGVQKLIVTNKWKAISKERTMIHVYAGGKTSSERIDPFFTYGTMRLSRDETVAGYSDQSVLHLFTIHPEIKKFSIRDSTGIRSWAIDGANNVFFINHNGDVYKIALPSTKKQLVIRTGSRGVNNIDVTAEGNKLALATLNDSLVVYDLKAKAIIHKSYIRYLQELRFTAGDTQLITSGFYSKVKILNTSDFTSSDLDIYLRNSITQDVVTDEKGQVVAFIDADYNLLLYDAKSRKLKEKMDNNVSTASINASESFAAYVRHRTLVICDLKTGRPLSKWCFYKNPSGFKIKSQIIK